MERLEAGERQRYLMLVVMCGLPGTGKTTVASALARRLRWPVLSVDPVEAALAALEPSSERGLAAYKVVQSLVDRQLGLGLDMIVDAVNPVREARQVWIDLAARHESALLLLELSCSDPDLHRQRVESREDGMSDWNRVLRRREEYEVWESPPLRLDSLLPLEHNLELVLSRLRSL